jgi:hypothetical protein
MIDAAEVPSLTCEATANAPDVEYRKLVCFSGFVEVE